MRISAVVSLPTGQNLRLLAPPGVEDPVYYISQGMPPELDALRRGQVRVEQCSQRISDAEGGPRSQFVPGRDVAGPLKDFRETFPGNGQTDMAAVFLACREIVSTGFIRPDRVLQLITEHGENDGYGLLGNIFAIAYLKGLMEPLFGKPGFR
ncbi:MAG: hypothetical protein EXS42_05845 [Lacunisphaera sp.]|nr:hypothetical protein [Lacunisphaera sp.]